MTEADELNPADFRIRNARFERLAIAMMTDEQAEASWERWKAMRAQE